QRLQVKCSRSAALSYCLDNGWREESEPGKAGDVALLQSPAPSNFTRTAHSTRGDFLEPPPGARHPPQQTGAGPAGQVVLALDYDPQFHAAAFHLHWDEAIKTKDLLACVVVIWGEWNFEADSNAVLGEAHLFYDLYEGCRSFGVE